MEICAVYYDESVQKMTDMEDVNLNQRVYIMGACRTAIGSMGGGGCSVQFLQWIWGPQ